MKTTIDIADDLYRRVKAKAAMEGCTIRELTEELYRRWLVGRPSAGPDPAEDAQVWVERWTHQADRTVRKTRSRPTAREEVGKDRDRLEPR